MKKRSGYILVLTLMVTSLAVGLVTAIVRQSFTYRKRLCAVFVRERARMLALSSLEIAVAQLSLVVPKEEAQPAGAAQQLTSAENKDPLVQWAEKAVPLLNKWQVFDFAERSTDGIEGTVRLFIASENGKLSLPSLVKPVEQAKPAPPNQQKPPAKGAPARPTPTPAIKKEPLLFIDPLFMSDKEVSLKNALADFKKRFKRLPEDPSELLRIENVAARYKDQLFTRPEGNERSLVIMDLFSTASTDGKINPFFITRSLRQLLGFSELKDSKALLKGVKASMNWSTEWDKLFAPQYGKTYGSLDPSFKEMLATSFKPTAFSVVSYCRVGSITQRVYALIETVTPDETISPKSMIFKVSRVYWF